MKEGLSLLLIQHADVITWGCKDDINCSLRQFSPQLIQCKPLQLFFLMFLYVSVCISTNKIGKVQVNHCTCLLLCTNWPTSCRQAEHGRVQDEAEREERGNRWAAEHEEGKNQQNKWDYSTIGERFKPPEEWTQFELCSRHRLCTTAQNFSGNTTLCFFGVLPCSCVFVNWGWPSLWGWSAAVGGAPDMW